MNRIKMRDLLDRALDEQSMLNLITTNPQAAFVDGANTKSMRVENWAAAHRAVLDALRGDDGVMHLLQAVADDLSGLENELVDDARDPDLDWRTTARKLGVADGVAEARHRLIHLTLVIESALKLAE